MSEMRQILCMLTEFNASSAWGPQDRVHLDKHQVQGKHFDLFFLLSKSKCKYINLIHSQYKNKIIYFNMFVKIIYKMAIECH